MVQSKINMDPDETIEGSPSEATPLEEEATPSEDTETAATDTGTEGAAGDVPAEEEMFELPDGRKVDAATLSREWKENFYPDYTKKSQALAARDQPTTERPADPLADPNYIPPTYGDLAAEIKRQVFAEMTEAQQAEAQARQALEDSVLQQITDIKSVDPTLNENALFQHATKYGFRDLKLAHQNMKDMAGIVKQTQKVTADNIQRRADPVSVSPGATGGKLNPSDFGSAVDFLRALKGTG